MTYHYLMDLALILLSTKVLGILTKRFALPQVVGALLAGLLLLQQLLGTLEFSAMAEAVSALPPKKEPSASSSATENRLA